MTDPFDELAPERFFCAASDCEFYSPTEEGLERHRRDTHPTPLDLEEAAPAPAPSEAQPEPEQPPTAQRVCQAPGCDTVLPEQDGKRGARRRWCDEHQPGKRAARTVKPPATPKHVLSRDDELKRVEANAKFIVEMLAGGLMVVGGDNPALVADAIDLQKGAPPLGAAVANVAKYEDWLRRALSGGQASDRGQAWIMLLITLGTVSLPILLRHNLIPPAIAELAQMAGQATAENVNAVANGPETVAA